MEGTSSMVVNEEDDVIMVLPPGFRFHPTDEEIITHYLTKKVMDDRFTAIAIGQVDMNKCEPWDLPKKAKMKEKEWFFFCQRDRKYPTGMRTNRATGTGYWKATGKDREIYNNNNNNNKRGSNNKSCLVGMKKTLVFYKGRAPKGEKTNWVMHEYRLEGRIPYYRGAKDEWVVCKIFQKNRGIIKRNLFAHELSRNDSYNIDEILGSPSPLPPLMDDIPSSSTHDHNNKPTIISSFTNDEHDFKDDVLQIQEHDQNSFFNIPTYPIINDFKSSYLNPINQENPSFFLNLYQECPNSSANHNSMISPSQDTAEISSSVISNRDNAPGITSNMDFEDLEGISVNHNMTDLESLWDY